MWITGTGVTHFGKRLEDPLAALSGEAVAKALEEADLNADEIEAVFFSNAAAGLMSGQEMVRGQVALRDTGLSGLPFFNVENACASAASAVHLACQSLAAGTYERAIVVGAEKLFDEDKAKTAAALASGGDIERIAALGGGPAMMNVYAEKTERYQAQSGALPEDFAAVVVKNRHNGTLNPIAQYKTETTVEEVLASRAISGPLTLLMCSPISDGAAAIVVSATPPKHDGAVRIRGSRLASGGGKGNLVERAARAAYEQAGIGPAEVDIAEVHDAAAPAELWILEELGLAGTGEALALLREGALGLDGRLPVNPSGGLISRGHPLGATGVAQLIELSTQLRGLAGDRQAGSPRVAIAENSGGYLGPDDAAAGVTILSRD